MNGIEHALDAPAQEAQKNRADVGECGAPTGLGLYPFDARGIAKRFRHAAIFGALRALHPGETMRFYNDHDPLPLLAQITKTFGSGVTISYLSRSAAEVIIDFHIAR